MPPLVRCRAGNAKSPMTSGGGHGLCGPSAGEGWGWWLSCRGTGAQLRPAPLLEYRGLEGAELEHPREAGEVAAMAQLGMAIRADQPTMFRPVEAAMEEVVELGAGHRPAGPAEDRRVAAAGTLALEGLGRHHPGDGGLATVREVPP